MHLKILQILVLDCIISWAGVVDELDFARRLHNWIFKGFPDLGDTEGIVLSEIVKQVKVDYHMSHVTRKPVFGVCDQVRLKLACSGTESLEISDLASIDIILSRQRITKVQIRLRGCAG